MNAIKQGLFYFIMTVSCIIFCAAVADKNCTTIYLIGDSTMADYTGDYDKGKDYMKTRYPLTGWGQIFQGYFISDSLELVNEIIQTDCVIVDDRARGGRSTRTFFQEGRWRNVYDNLQKDDIVLIQFGHNDASVKKTERYVNIEGYKEFLRLYISQTLQKGGRPMVLTPVARNYPWVEDVLTNCHGAYPAAAKEVAAEFEVPVIDLGQLSMDFFTAKGQEYVTKNYFMNFPPGSFEAYPDGKNDNTHFQPAGAHAIAQLVFNALKN